MVCVCVCVSVVCGVVCHDVGRNRKTIPGVELTEGVSQTLVPETSNAVHSRTFGAPAVGK